MTKERESSRPVTFIRVSLSVSIQENLSQRWMHSKERKSTQRHQQQAALCTILYTKRSDGGEFILDVEYQSVHLFILKCSLDATIDDGRAGRCINHSKTAPNLVPKLIETPDGKPHIIFIAAINISAKQEILYDYGERDPKIIHNHPWLSK